MPFGTHKLLRRIAFAKSLNESDTDDSSIAYLSTCRTIRMCFQRIRSLFEAIQSLWMGGTQAADADGEKVQLALRELELSQEQCDRFFSGEKVVFQFRTGISHGIAVLALDRNRLRLGIITINEPGEAIGAILRLKRRASKLAKLLGCNEIEIFGAAFTNERFEALLRRRGFEESEEACPTELGGDTIMILSKIERVEEANQ